MDKSLFSTDQHARQDQNRNCGERQQDLCRGDFWFEGADRVEVNSQSRKVGQVSIVRWRSTTDFFFRRTQQHIRNDRADSAVLWFPNFGQIAFSSRAGCQVVEAGDFAITRSAEPFSMVCRADTEAVHEVLHVTIPTDILRGHFNLDETKGPLVFPGGSELKVARSLFTDVFEESDGLDEVSARLIMTTGLRLVGSVVRADEPQPRDSITQRRQRDIRRFIEVNLSNPRLSGKILASGCGVSSRYLSALFARMGTSFSQMVWDQRMERARQYLESKDMVQLTIAEIAFDLGFKSAAHFSRRYKLIFGISPSDYRSECHGERRIHSTLRSAGRPDNAAPTFSQTGQKT